MKVNATELREYTELKSATMNTNRIQMDVSGGRRASGSYTREYK